MTKRKLTAVVIVTIVFLSTVFVSCRSNKPPCPAYQSINIENIFSNIVK